MRLEYESLEDLLTDLKVIDDEGTRIELKRAKDGLSHRFWQTASAFSNTLGGYILLGIEDKTKSLVAELDIDALQKSIASNISQRLSPVITPLIEVVKIKGTKVIVVNIHPAEVRQKPVYFLDKGGGRIAYKRVSSSNIQMVQEEIDVFLIEKSGMSPDAMPMKHFWIDHLDPEALQRYRNRLRAFPQAQKLLERDDVGLLKGLNALHYDAESNSWSLSNAALLLFGKPEFILSRFPSLEVQILRFDSSPTVEDRGKKESISGVALIDFVGEVENVLKNLVPYGKIRVTSGRIARDADNVYIALREAIVNAIVHQDFLANRYIQIRIYGDRLEIENAGYSKKSTDDFKEPGSIPRNPIVARAFEMAGFVEKQGLGASTMIKAMAAAGFGEPKFISNIHKNSFSVSFFWHHFMSQEDLNWISDLRDISKEDEKTAMVLLRQQGTINNETIREKLGYDTLSASKVLRGLTRKGYLQKSGPNSASIYRLTPKAGPPKVLARPNPSDLPPLLASMTLPASSADIPIVESPAGQVDQSGLAGPLYDFNFRQQPEDHIGIHSSSISHPSEDAIGIHSSTTNDQFSDVALLFPNRRQALIATRVLAFIQDDFQPLAAIAEHIKMGEDNIRKTYLDRLIGIGLVMRKLPGKRPRGQAYKAVNQDETPQS